MSPEHIRDPRNVDGRADIWSLGVAAYVLLSTCYPFQGSSAPEIFLAILGHRYESVRERGVDVPPAIDAIIGRCLAPSREERFPDVGALAVAIAPFASPSWRGYGERVAEIVRRSPSRFAQERPRSTTNRPRGITDTRSVPAPGSEREAVASGPALAYAPTVFSTFPEEPRVVPPSSRRSVASARAGGISTKGRMASTLPRRSMLLAGFAIGVVFVAAVKVGARPAPLPADTSFPPPPPAPIAAQATGPLGIELADPATMIAPVPMAVPVASAPIASAAAPARSSRGRHPPRPHTGSVVPLGGVPSPSASPEPPPASTASQSDPNLLPNPYRKP
jgi:serine/threonine-protein kinase